MKNAKLDLALQVAQLKAQLAQAEAEAMPATVTPISKAKAKAPTKQAPMLHIVTSSTTALDLPIAEFDYSLLSDVAVSDATFAQSAIVAIFAGLELPTFAGYKASVKERNATLPVKERVALPKRETHGDIYQRFHKLTAISKAIEAGYEPLKYWNNHAITATRARMPNINVIEKGARAFMGDAKEPEAPEAIAEKRLLAAYKALQECKATKLYTDATAKMVALLAGLKIQLPAVE